MTAPEFISPWLEGLGPETEPLRGERKTDVVILGAGFAGLSSALALRRQGLSVCLLEARFSGFGASGRNAGHLTPTIGKDLPTLNRVYGKDRVQGLVQLAEASISHVESLIERFEIDCDYEPVGNIVAAVHPRQFRNLDRAAEAADRCGVRGAILEPDAMRRRGLPRRFLRGYLEPHGGFLHPGKYLRGLRQAALQAGAELYEQTPATRIEHTNPMHVYTPEGSVQARHVVVATNAFTPSLGILRSSVLRLQVQLFRTAPLNAAQQSAVAWSEREGIYTAHEMLESYRLTADQRIVGGAKDVRYGFGRTTLPDVDRSVAHRLETIFRQRFPELADLEITDHWGGPICMSLDFLPLLGHARRKRNLLYAIAFAGHGIALASYAGEMIADLLLEQDGPGRPLWSRHRVPPLPEPLRWLVFHALTGLFAGIDARVDRSIE